MEHNFNALNEDRRRTEEDYNARIETSINFIGSLRNEIEDQKAIQADRKKQNADLFEELARQRAALDDRAQEISRIKLELQ